VLNVLVELQTNLLSPTFSTSNLEQNKSVVKGQLMRVPMLNRWVMFGVAVGIAFCILETNAVAGITITLPQTSTAKYEVRGFGGFPANEIHLQPPTTTGASAFAGTDFDSGDGFKGHVEASTSITSTVGYNSLLLDSVTSTTALFTNLSPTFPDDWSFSASQAYAYSDTLMGFHTDEAGVAKVTWNYPDSFVQLGTLSLGDGFSRRTSMFMILTREDFTEMATITAVLDTNGVFITPEILSSNGIFNDNFATLKLTPGNYLIRTISETFIDVQGFPHWLTTPVGNRASITVDVITEAVDPNAAVPEPASLGIFGGLGLAALVAARRRKK
jgi:hypothetical protein